MVDRAARVVVVAAVAVLVAALVVGLAARGWWIEKTRA